MHRQRESMLHTLASPLSIRRIAEYLEWLKGQHGSSLVEFALVLILFCMMLFGVAGFGHALYVYHFVSHASKSATRWAAVNGSTCAQDGSCNGVNGMSNGPADANAVLTYVKNLAPPWIDTTKITTPVICGVAGVSNCADSTPATCAATPNSPGCTVEVQVSYNYSFVFPLVINKSMTLSSTSEMIITH